MYLGTEVKWTTVLNTCIPVELFTLNVGELNWTDLHQVDPVTRRVIGHARQRHEVDWLPCAHRSSVEFVCCKHGLTPRASAEGNLSCQNNVCRWSSTTVRRLYWTTLSRRSVAWWRQRLTSIDSTITPQRSPSPSSAPPRLSYTQRKCAENCNKWRNNVFFLKLQSAFW